MIMHKIKLDIGELILLGITFFIPYTAYRIMGLKISEVLTLLLIFLMFMHGHLYIGRNRSTIRYVVLLAAVILVSALFSLLDPVNALRKGADQGIYYSFEFGWVFRLVRLLIVLFYTIELSNYYSKGHRNFKLVADTYIISNVLLDLYGVYDNFSHGRYGFGFYRNRLMAVEASEAGFINCVAIILAMYIFIMSKKKRYLVCEVILIFGQLVIGSTASLVALGASLSFSWIIFTYHDGKDILKKIARLAVFIGLGITVYSYVANNTTILNKIVNYKIYMNQQNSSVAERITAIISGWKMFLKRPVLGLGFGNYGWYIAEFRTSNLLSISPGGFFQPNCMYIQLLSELGVVGFTGYMIFVIQKFINIFKARRLNTGLKYFVYIHITLFVYLMVHNFSLTTFFSFQFWMCVAGTDALLYRKGKG